MNKSVNHFFHQALDDSEGPSRFHRVIPVHDNKDLTLTELQKYTPRFPRGWYELSRVSTSDRIEFIREFWRSTLPYLPHCDEAITAFFDRLDDIGIYLIQQKEKTPFEAQMVYSLADNSSFFHGMLPIEESSLLKLHQGVEGLLLPADYLAFLQIHDGFCKYTDTGLILSNQIVETYQFFQSFLKENDPLETASGELINNKKLLPFYESFGQHCYQCFYGEWYPEQEMGNLYFSGVDPTLSDFEDLENLELNMAYPTFLDWLIFYLDKII